MSRFEEEEHSHHHRRHRRRRHREKKKKSGNCSKKESSLKKKKNFADVSSSSTTSVPNDNPFSTEFELTNTNSTLDAFSIYGNTSSNDTAESGSKRKMAAPSTSHYETESSKRNDYIQDNDKSAALKGHICCVHGNLKCQKGLKEKSKKKKKKRGKKEDDNMTEEKTGPYETANKYLKMKTISASDIASPNQSVQRVSSKHHQHRPHRRHRHRPRSRVSEICSSPATSSTTTKSQAELSNGYVRVSKEHPPKSPVTTVLRYENYNPKNQELINDELKDDDNNNDYVLFKKFLTKQSSKNVGGKKDGYEVIDDDEDDYKSKSRSLRKPHVEKKESASDNTFERVFLGEMTSKEAERKSLNCSSFRLYYRLPTITPDSYDRLPPKLALYIIYRNSRGNFYHFPIIARKIHSYNGPEITQLTVEYGEIAPNFDSLSALVKYYETYCIIYGKHLEIFPWWHSDSNVKEKNHHKSSRKKYPRHCNHF